MLNQHRIIWEEKPVLRAVYHQYYQRILQFVRPGQTLEVGGGTGNLKNYLQNVISTDILKLPWLDAACNAEALPFKDQGFDNIVLVDVLHHIEHPNRFFKETQRVLNNGGRLILLEPAITKISWIFYHFFHPEPVDLHDNPLIERTSNPNRQAFDANQAIPELIFGKFKHEFNSQFPVFQIIHKSYLSLWVYPLSGGFRKWCLIPKSWVNALLNIEQKIECWLGKYFGFRLFVVLEKRGQHA